LCLDFFPFGEKLIAPEMQCIVHAVVFKTKRNKVELQNKVDNKVVVQFAPKWTF
jgi:hypothetical protein